MSLKRQRGQVRLWSNHWSRHSAWNECLQGRSHTRPLQSSMQIGQSSSVAEGDTSRVGKLVCLLILDKRAMCFTRERNTIVRVQKRKMDEK